jgi:hypothetical protein
MLNAETSPAKLAVYRYFPEGEIATARGLASVGYGEPAIGVRTPFVPFRLYPDTVLSPEFAT